MSQYAHPLSDQLAMWQQQLGLGDWNAVTDRPYLYVHISDPEWRLLSSGAIGVDEDGLLDALGVRADGRMWWLRVVDAVNTDSGPAEITLTFDERPPDSWFAEAA